MKPRLVFSSSLLMALVLTLAPTALASNTWYVDGVHGNDNNNCKSPQTACKTIGHAISLAHSGDSITIAPATYKENVSITVSLTITGTGAGTTIIDGQLIRTGFWTAPNTDVTLSDVTIQHGYSPNGGGVFNNGVLTINNSIISMSFAVYIAGGSGGGIFNNGTLTINNCTISGNSAQGGGSHYHHYSSGGGIESVAYAKLTVNNSTLNGNSAYYGSGIFNYGPVTINNSTLSGNYTNGKSSAGNGAGIWNDGRFGKVTLSNTTISGNSAAAGGGIVNGPDGGTVSLQNSIVAGNSGGNCSGTIISKGYNLSSDKSCNFHGNGDRNSTNPLLGPLQNNGGPTPTEALLNGSPAIDAGNPKGCTDGNGNLLKTDQRGYPRPDKEDSGSCDMGAYERQTD